MTNEELEIELKKKAGKGTRNIAISPIFEAGKVYNLYTQLEDPQGTLKPTNTHCWLTWESQIILFQKETWMRQAHDFKTIEDAEQAKSYLQKYEQR